MTDDESDVDRFLAAVDGLSRPDLHRKGVLVVSTESGSVYVVDCDAGYLTRTPGTTMPADPEVEFPADLRRDHERIKLLRINVLETGRRAVFDVEGLSEGAWFTRRTTTIVTEIVALPTGIAAPEST